MEVRCGISLPRVVVAAQGVPVGVPAYYLRQPSGAPVRGRVIGLDDPCIPPVLFHVTAALAQVRRAGRLLAGGSGGLGGDQRDQIVSFTTRREVAEQLASDMRLVIAAARASGGPAPAYWWDEQERRWRGDRSEWGERVARVLADDLSTDTRGFGLLPLQLQSYNFSDLLVSYFGWREGARRIPDPMFFGATQEGWAGRRRRDVGVVEVPRSALATGALITDFDLNNSYGLAEIRIYGDVDLGRRRRPVRTSGPGLLPMTI
jgi:hypothetical protein